MSEQTSSIGNHLAELYNSIHLHNKHVEDAKAKVQEAEKALAKVKSDFADYLKQQGIDKLLAPTQAEVEPSNGGKTSNGASKERKPRISAEDKQTQVERNKATYTSAYPNGIDERTGLPKRFKGRGQGNVGIDAQMKDDERDHQEKQQNDASTFTEENHLESLDDKLLKEVEVKPVPKAKKK
jgi:hypothetical protein